MTTYPLGTVFLARIVVVGRTNKRGKRWVIFNGADLLQGFAGETRQDLYLRWIGTHDVPLKVVRYTDTMTLAELAMTMADLRLGDTP